MFRVRGLWIEDGASGRVVMQLVTVMEIQWVWYFVIGSGAEIWHCVGNHNRCMSIQGPGP